MELANTVRVQGCTNHLIAYYLCRRRRSFSRATSASNLFTSTHNLSTNAPMVRSMETYFCCHFEQLLCPSVARSRVLPCVNNKLGQLIELAVHVLCLSRIAARRQPHSHSFSSAISSGSTWRWKL